MHQWLRLRLLSRRLLLGPLAVAIFAGTQLASYGTLAAALGAYATFVTAEAAVLAWDKLHGSGNRSTARCE
jgi:hypothetical protein